MSSQVVAVNFIKKNSSLVFVDNFIALQENQTYISAGNLSFWDEQNKKKIALTTEWKKFNNHLAWPRYKLGKVTLLYANPKSHIFFGNINK